MFFVDAEINRKVNIYELKELVCLMENQETTDKFVDTEIEIYGEYAKINVKIDEYGNVVLL